MSEDRYARLTAIDWWDGTRVRNATAIVAGAGALGNEVVKNLVLLGWGTVVVVDHDVVAMSNLTRSMFFDQADIGRPKAETISERAGRLNSDTRVIGLAGDLRVALSAGIVRRSDLVFGCLDNLAARVALSQLAGYAGRLMVDGGLTTWEGTVQVFAPEVDQPCFTCGLTADDLRELTLRQSCLAYEQRSLAAGGVPTTPTVTSVTAGLMVQEALKWLHRDLHDHSMAVGHELRIDLAHNRFWNHRLPVNDDCVLHWTRAEPMPPDHELNWTDDWRTIVARCRAVVTMPDGVLQLPARLLVRWDCPDCGSGGESLRAHALDGRVPCPSCGHDVIPQFTAHVDGTEPWADRSPEAMGFAPWTWLELRDDHGVATFELAGASAPLEHLEVGT